MNEDDSERFTHYREAAERGYADAQWMCDLGLMYAQDCGVPRDERKAVEWFQKAAEQGLAAAQSNLGVMYAKGCGVPKDERKAVEWYQKAAEQGYAK